MTFDANGEAAYAVSEEMTRTASLFDARRAVGKPVRILLLARRFKLPYRVLRCASLAGAEVFVLGAKQTRRLRFSRYCQGFFETRHGIDGSLNADLADEINRYCARLRIDMVLAGDAPSTRSLIQLQEALSVRCFPMPSLAQYDHLNNKWRFGLLCGTLGIDYPESHLFPSIEALTREIERHGLAATSMAKPLAWDGGDGCVRLTQGNCLAQLSQITYEPILLQTFIEGEDIGASVFCVAGDIKAFIAHKYENDAYSSFHDEGVYKSIERIMAHVKADGVFNFDMRRGVDGRIFFLECNPRFYFKIAMSMLLGINFVGFGLPDAPRTSGLITCATKIARFPKAFLWQTARLRAPEPESWGALNFVFADPVPYGLELLGCQEPRVK